MQKAMWSARLRAGLMVGLALMVNSCGDLQRQGTGSSYLILGLFEGASGITPEEFGNPIISDVITIVNDAPLFYNDLGRVTMTLGMKDPGGSTSPTSPTSANFITLNRYRVRYIRTDGRNTPGVDVPYPFDGGLTATIGAGETEVAFTIVRHTAKIEAPLATLYDSFMILDTIAEVTFYGRDQTGREVQATGTILISFGNFGDPD